MRFPVHNVVANEYDGFYNDTIVDGELVTDREPNGQMVVRYLAFDLLASQGQNIISKPLTKRLAVGSGPFDDIAHWSCLQLTNGF